MKKLFLLIPTLFVASLSLRAETPAERLANWPQWRGPEANGTAPTADPPLRWDDKTNVTWKTPLPGRGTSTPIIWGDHIFLLTAIDTGKKADAQDIPRPDPNIKPHTNPPKRHFQFDVLCVDRRTGKIRWQETATTAGVPPSMATRSVHSSS